MFYQYGQVVGDYVEYVVSVWTSARRLCRLCCIDLVIILFIVKCCCNWTFAIHCTRYISCVVQLLPVMQWYGIGNVATTLATSTTAALFEAMLMYWMFLCAKRATIMPMNSNCLNPIVCIWCTLSLIGDYACIYLFTADHVMCSGSIVLLQGKGKLILVYCYRSSYKKKIKNKK